MPSASKINFDKIKNELEKASSAIELAEAFQEIKSWVSAKFEGELKRLHEQTEEINAMSEKL